MRPDRDRAPPSQSPPRGPEGNPLPPPGCPQRWGQGCRQQGSLAGSHGGGQRGMDVGKALLVSAAGLL